MTKAGYLIMVATLAGAVTLCLGQQLIDPSMPTDRTIVGNCLVTFATTLTALLIRLPQRPWSDEERAAKETA